MRWGLCSPFAVCMVHVFADASVAAFVACLFADAAVAFRVVAWRGSNLFRSLGGVDRGHGAHQRGLAEGVRKRSSG